MALGKNPAYIPGTPKYKKDEKNNRHVGHPLFPSRFGLCTVVL